jgi:hypothetical protein
MPADGERLIMLGGCVVSPVVPVSACAGHEDAVHVELASAVMKTNPAKFSGRRCPTRGAGAGAAVDALGISERLTSALMLDDDFESPTR